MARKLEPDIEHWLTEVDASLEPGLRRVIDVVLRADRRMTAYIKHGTVQLAYGGDMAAFVQPKGDRISLMFYRGAKIPGDFPHLEGDGPTARFMRFGDLGEVKEREGELAAIIRSWCQMRSD